MEKPRFPQVFFGFRRFFWNFLDFAPILPDLEHRTQRLHRPNPAQ